MYIGNRRIRSAGRSSGSIEVTLPSQLHELEGIECRLLVRDGPRPEIVLQPDLSAAQALFQELWARLRLGLSSIDEIGDFALSDVCLTLFPSSSWGERPSLACTDALAVARTRHIDAMGLGEPALTRLITALATLAAQRLDLRERMALAFGDAVAYLITGSSMGMGNEFERGMAHQLAQPPLGHDLSATALQPATWQRLQPGLHAIYEQFICWQHEPASYAADRERWYRALTVEIGRWTVEDHGRTR